MDDNYKIRLPLTSSGALRNEVSDASDKAIENTRDVIAQNQLKLISVMKSLSTFRQK